MTLLIALTAIWFIGSVFFMATVIWTVQELGRSLHLPNVNTRALANYDDRG